MSWGPDLVSTTSPVTGRSFSVSSPDVVRASRAKTVLHVSPRSVDLATITLVWVRVVSSQAWVARYNEPSRPQASGAWKMFELLARQYGWVLMAGSESRIFQVLPASSDRTMPQRRARNSMYPPTITFGSSGLASRYGALYVRCGLRSPLVMSTGLTSCGAVAAPLPVPDTSATSATASDARPRRDAFFMDDSPPRTTYVGWSVEEKAPEM